MASHGDYVRMDYERERAGIPLYPVGHPQHNPDHAFAFGLAHRYRQTQTAAPAMPSVAPIGGGGEWSQALQQLGGPPNVAPPYRY